jgi:hypothetical protein
MYLNQQFIKCLGMPRLENNFAEGIVIKMDSEHLTNTDRPILKIKSPDFLEVTTPRGRVKPKEPQPENADIEDLKRYITKNRLDGIIGKEGPSCHPKKLKNLFIADAINDFLKDFPENESLFKSFEANIRKQLSYFVDSEKMIE